MAFAPYSSIPNMHLCLHRCSLEANPKPGWLDSLQGKTIWFREQRCMYCNQTNASNLLLPEPSFKEEKNVCLQQTIFFAVLRYGKMCKTCWQCNIITSTVPVQKYIYSSISSCSLHSELATEALPIDTPPASHAYTHCKMCAAQFRKIAKQH